MAKIDWNKIPTYGNYAEWIFKLVAAVEQYEDEHAKDWHCFKEALDNVPNQLRFLARNAVGVQGGSGTHPVTDDLGQLKIGSMTRDQLIEEITSDQRRTLNKAETDDLKSHVIRVRLAALHRELHE